jgi:organic hydroperoxide reductase OsmC/OhrA
VKLHHYKTAVEWTGNTGEGTKSYQAYRRDHEIQVEGKPVIAASSDPAFRGDPTRHNPEELLVASLSSCHMLWYLHLCAVSQIVVLAYRDESWGEMREQADGSGEFIRVILRPRATITGASDRAKALALHAQAHHHCFIANSVKFPVEIEAEILA